MADVNLSVEVTNAGVGEAIASINKLKAAGETARGGLADLGRSLSKAMESVSSSTARGGTSISNFGKAITSTNKEAISLRRSLKELEAGYSQIGKLNPGGDATSRLTRLGGAGGLQAGLATARTVQTARESFNADPVKDLIAYERQLAQLQEQRIARQARVNAQEGAKAGLARSREDLANQRAGITAVERAQLNLTRATQELNQAEAARRATGIGADNAKRTAALNAENAAVRQLASAERDLASARQAEASSKQQKTEEYNAGGAGGGAFQSSFSFFIIAGLAQQTSQAILGVGAAAITASSQMERAFANVDRTFDGTDRQLGSLRSKLLQLSTTTPISFVDLSEIAALGNQLGIAANDIQSFTQVIAQYSAISGQSAEDAATAFGQIANLTDLDASKFANLASSITYVARTSVATEGTIQQTSKEISALAAGAGFSAQSIVGLAGALSSLAIPPERARGALSLYFGALNGAVAEGGPKLEAFAQLTGKTTDEIGRLVRENKGQEVFTSFIQGLSQLDSVAKTSALDTLGLSTIRVDQTMRALAQNVPLVTQSLEGANAAFEANSELGSQYATIQATLNSKFIEFQNAMTNAAGAIGDQLAPALSNLLSVATDVIVNFTEFANSPIGSAIVKLAGIIAGLVLVMSTVVGAASLAKAAMVVIPWALTGLGAKAAEGSIVNFIRGLVGIGPAATTGAAGTVALSGGLTTTGAAARGAAAGLSTMKFALISTGIGAAVVLIGTLVAALSEAQNSSKLTADSITGLAEAVAADTATYNETGEAIETFKVSTASATEEQKKAASEGRSLAAVWGDDLVDGANKASNAISKIAAGEQVSKAIADTLRADDDVKNITKDSKFSKQFTGLGFDMASLINTGIKTGNSSKTLDTLLKQADIVRKKGEGAGAVTTYSKDGKDVSQFVSQLRTLVVATSSANGAITEFANTENVIGSGFEATGAATEELSAGFLGATSSLTAYQDAVQSGLQGFVEFGNVLSAVKEKAGDDLSLINASSFRAELDKANTDAVGFFDGIKQLAATGSTAFATQLAALGPEAAPIVASALSDPGGLAGLEEGARFAAFLASDAFKAALETEMSNSNDAYGLIFKTTGNLSDVQSYIAAQVAGVGEEYEAQWLLNHPDLPLNVDLQGLDPSDIATFNAQTSGEIKIEAGVKPILDKNGIQRGLDEVKTYTDTLTGASITLPASLSGPALTESLALWRQNQAATPADIQSKLNTAGFSPAVEAWKAANGAIKVLGTLTATNSAQSVFGNQTVQIRSVLVDNLTGRTTARKVGAVQSQGGPAGWSHYPKFATGGGYRVRGPGTGTSDSILARLSTGEYVNTDKARKYWGTDFFDSLNRKMLPTTFLNMLGGASVSGNQGPTHVANVNVVQNNPLTRDPLKQLRADSELVASGIWGS